MFVLFSVSPAVIAGDISVVLPVVPVTIVKPVVSLPVSVPSSSWQPDQWATWPFITINGVSGDKTSPWLKLSEN